MIIRKRYFLSFKRLCTFKKANDAVLLVDIGFLSRNSERQFLKYVDSRVAVFLFWDLNAESRVPVRFFCEPAQNAVGRAPLPGVCPRAWPRCLDQGPALHFLSP